MSTLYHGTSKTIAKAIIDEGCLRPAGTMPTANPAHVYFIKTFHHALMFGYSRVMGRWIDGKFKGLSSFVNGRTYDDVAVFVIDEGSLDKRLFRPDDFFKGETAYESTVPGDAMTHMVCMPVTKKLITFLTSMHNEGLAKYVGVDLIEHLGAKTFDPRRDVSKIAAKTRQKASNNPIESSPFVRLY